MRQVFLSASIKRVHYFHEDKPLCLVPHRRYDDLVQVGREGGREEEKKETGLMVVKEDKPQT